MRITRSVLQSQVDRLNEVLNRPRTGWTKQTKHGVAALVSNEGHFLLDTSSPGDGWTRYTLSEIVGKNGGQRNISPCCNLQEMWNYLRGVFDVLDSVHSGNVDTFHKKDARTEEYCICGRVRSACTADYAKNLNTLHADKDGAA